MNVGGTKEARVSPIARALPADTRSDALQVHAAHVRAFEARRWAAEDLALELGWIRECPFHGEPFRAPGAPSDAAGRSALAARLADTALFAFAREVTRSFPERCLTCAREVASPD